jgi:putative phage-type endonuclease
MIVTDRAEWLRARKEGIGASEAAAALGMSPFESPRELYLRKLGMLPDVEETEAMAEGSFMEPYIARRYMERTGRLITGTQLFYRSPITCLMATIDGMTDAGYPVEFKWTTRPGNLDLGEEATDDLPPHWLIQGHQQMILTGTARVDFAVKAPGRPVRIFDVRRDEELCESIIIGVRRFWADVQNRVVPESNGRADARTLHLIYPDSLGEVALDDHAARLIDDYERLGGECKALDEERAEAKAAILEILGNHALGRLPDGRCITRKVVTVGEKTYTRKGYSFTGMWIGKGGRN